MPTSKIQLKRTTISQKRPRVDTLLPGEVALNIEKSEQGAYFSSSQNELLKIGTPYIGEDLPNFRGAGVNGGEIGYCQGELWFRPSTNSLYIYVAPNWVQIN